MGDASSVDVRMVDWNINGFSELRGQAELLAELDWNVCTLQEVTEGTWPELRQLGDDSAISRDSMPPLAGKAPRYHAAVLVRDLRLVDAGILRDLPSPERSLVARLESGDGHPFVAASLASPPGVSWGDAGKGRQVSRIAAWLADRRLPTVVGMDANAPKFERLDPAATEWWNPEEPVLFGEDRPHDLRDVFREYLSTDPARWKAVEARFPEGPLAVSYDRGRGERSVPCRYDVILASPEFSVGRVEYRYDDAIAAGSDHGLVVAHLTLRGTSPSTDVEPTSHPIDDEEPT